MMTRFEPTEGTHYIIFLLGIGALLGGALIWHFGIARNGWPVAQARVLTVEMSCQIQERSISHRRSPRPFILPCDQIDQFRANNPSNSWDLRYLYAGNVEVTGRVAPVVVEMDLSASRAKIGSTFDVVQNPDSASVVASVEQSTTEIYAGGSLAGLGVFLVAIGFFWF